MDEPMEELRRQFLAGDVDPVRFGDCAACPSLGVPAAAQKRSDVIRLTPV
jgi:hypothetical protein